MQNNMYIEGCIAIENEVASIYRFFMDLFPDNREFWADLYNDELNHSSWLSDILVVESIDLLPSEDLVPSRELINETLSFIKGKHAYIDKNPLTFEEALNIALQIEKLMVETFTNELSANLLSADYDTLSSKIIASEKIHVNKIEDMLLSKDLMHIS